MFMIPRNVKGKPRPGFTLIELLVVIAIIGILASMLLPTFGRGKGKAKVTQCLNNLHQIGIGVSLYTAEFTEYFPPGCLMETNGEPKCSKFGLGGNDPRPDDLTCMPSAGIRPLANYVKARETFRCPEDAGIETIPCSDPTLESLKPTCWESAGCSYDYNIYMAFMVYFRTRYPLEDGTGSLAGNKTAWVPNPSLFILVNEPPARSYQCVGGPPPCVFQHWHDRQKFISPILFVDGHAAQHDFTKTINADPDFIYEPTKDWIWYKPGGDKAGAYPF